MQKTEQQPAFVLHSRDYTDSRILVELFTAEFGRVATVYRFTSRQRASSRPQLFTPCLVDLYGKSSLKTLIRIEPSGSTLLYTGKPLYCGLYLNEILQRLLSAEDSYPSTFAAYQQCLQHLSVISPGQEDIPLREFELALLQELGYGIDFQMDVLGNPILQNAAMQYRFVVDDGFIPVVEDPQPGDIFSGEALALIANRDWQAKARNSAKRICRTALTERLGGKPLVSRELFKA